MPVEERSSLEGVCAVKSSEKSAGEEFENKLWQRVDSLQSMLERTGSQWNDCSRGRAWSRVRALGTSLAAQFRLFVCFIA